MADRPVWSLPQRLIHWSLVFGLGLAWWSAEVFDDLHEWTGYAVAALVGGRILLGFGHHPTARWDTLWARLRLLPAFLAMRGRLPMDSGHSPIGALSLLTLITLVLATSLTGWMLTLDTFAGDEAAEERHEMAFTLLQAWVALHVLAGLAQSLSRHRNLLLDMIRGGRAD